MIFLKNHAENKDGELVPDLYEVNASCLHLSFKEFQ